MLVEAAEKQAIDWARNRIFRKFTPLLGLEDDVLTEYLAKVEIPYMPFYAYYPDLAVFSDDPGSAGSLLASYERLCSVLVGRRCELQPPAESQRLKWRTAMQGREIPDKEVVLADLPIGSPSIRRTPGTVTRVFVSYVHEDSDTVDRIVRELRSHDIDVWLDRTSLEVGDRWKETIRNAIRDGDYFLACFSPAYSGRRRTYMNVELDIALEELRMRPRDRTWFLPITLGPCTIPSYPIGAGETLDDIHRIDLLHQWEEGTAKLIRVLESGKIGS